MSKEVTKHLSKPEKCFWYLLWVVFILVLLGAVYTAVSPFVK